MKIAGTSQLPFPPEKAYDLMQDPAMLALAIPGCNSLEKTGAHEYKLSLKMALASLSGQFEGKVTLTEPNRPYSFKMLVEGTGKIGFVKGEGVIKLSGLGDGISITSAITATGIEFEGDAQIGGSIATVGQRMIDTTSKMMVKQFFKKLDCFCFTPQILQPGESRQMPVAFVIESGLPQNVGTITLSYSFFEIEGAVKKAGL